MVLDPKCCWIPIHWPHQTTTQLMRVLLPRQLWADGTQTTQIDGQRANV